MQEEIKKKLEDKLERQRLRRECAFDDFDEFEWNDSVENLNGQT